MYLLLHQLGFVVLNLLIIMITSHLSRIQQIFAYSSPKTNEITYWTIELAWDWLSQAYFWMTLIYQHVWHVFYQILFPEKPVIRFKRIIIMSIDGRKQAIQNLDSLKFYLFSQNDQFSIQSIKASNACFLEYFEKMQKFIGVAAIKTWFSPSTSHETLKKEKLELFYYYLTFDHVIRIQQMYIPMLKIADFSEGSSYVIYMLTIIKINFQDMVLRILV